MLLEKVYNVLKEQGRFLIEILSIDWLLKNFVERLETEIDGIKIVGGKRV